MSLCLRKPDLFPARQGDFTDSMARTGFINIRSVMRGIFGDAIDQAGPAGGMDEEGEMNGAYRPTGHPGV